MTKGLKSHERDYNRDDHKGGNNKDWQCKNKRNK